MQDNDGDAFGDRSGELKHYNVEYGPAAVSIYPPEFTRQKNRPKWMVEDDHFNLDYIIFIVIQSRKST